MYWDLWKRWCRDVKAWRSAEGRRGGRAGGTGGRAAVGRHSLRRGGDGGREVHETGEGGELRGRTERDRLAHLIVIKFFVRVTIRSDGVRRDVRR